MKKTHKKTPVFGVSDKVIRRSGPCLETWDFQLKIGCT